MAKKKKTPAEETITQSALQVTVTITFPVTDADEVTSLRKHFADEDLSTALNNFYWTKAKAKSKLISITQKVEAVDAPKA